MIELMRPGYSVKIGSREFDAKNSIDLVSIRVARSVGLPIDSCEVVLLENDYSFSKDDEVRVRLGYDEELLPVFSGLVDNVEHGFSKLRLSALGLSSRLLRLKLNRVFLNQNASKIVENLAKEANLTVQGTSDGFVFLTYVVDDTASVYEHVLRLAERCGFDVRMADDDQLLFEKMEGGKTHSLGYGKEIIHVEKSELSQLYSSARVWGESPASFKGSDTSHWITKQEVKGEAGTGQPLSIHDPVIKSKETAEQVAQAKLKTLKRTLNMVVKTVGKPEIRLGDTVTVSDSPHPSIEGDFQVREIEHYLSKDEGFTTKIDCWMMEK
jgi:phage protein D